MCRVCLTLGLPTYKRILEKKKKTFVVFERLGLCPTWYAKSIVYAWIYLNKLSNRSSNQVTLITCRVNVSLRIFVLMPHFFQVRPRAFLTEIFLKVIKMQTLISNVLCHVNCLFDRILCFGYFPTGCDKIRS